MRSHFSDSFDSCDKNMHQRAHLVYVFGRILYISTTNAPSVLSSLSRLCAVRTQRLIVPLFTSPRALESLFTDCEISSVWFPRAGVTLMTESRSLPCSAPCHQSRGVAETHSLTPPAPTSHAPLCMTNTPLNMISTSSSSIRPAAKTSAC